MRGNVLALAFMAACCTRLVAQTPQAVPVGTALAGAASELTGVALPPASAFVTGDREIAAGTTVKGPIAITGTLKVSGTIDGDAFANGGDVIVARGGHITGSAYAINGRVQIGDGVIDGEWRNVGNVRGIVTVTAPPESIGHNLNLTLGWAAVAFLIGLGLLTFGGPTLNAVGDVIDQQFGRSFLVGIGATIAIVPGLGLLVIGLALTIVGVLLIPFAIVAYILAVIGLVTLGFLAAVRISGQALPGSARTLSDRSASVRALVVGLMFFLGLWVIAALLTPLPTAMSIARVIAFAITWAAATVGLGATIISRAGTRPVKRSLYAPPAVVNTAAEQAAPFIAPLPDWQTPTPVAGVVAARRSSSTPSQAS